MLIACHHRKSYLEVCMPKETFQIQLSFAERARLQALGTHSSATAQTHIHARILLKADHATRTWLGEWRFHSYGFQHVLGRADWDPDTLRDRLQA
jgi:hypothetical protein